MDLKEVILKALAEAPMPLTSHQIAKECRKHLPGRITGQQVYAILCGPLRPQLTVTPSYRWSLLRCTNDHAGPKPVNRRATDIVIVESEQADCGVRIGDQEYSLAHDHRAIGSENSVIPGELDSPPDMFEGGAFLMLDDDDWPCS